LTEKHDQVWKYVSQIPTAMRPGSVASFHRLEVIKGGEHDEAVVDQAVHEGGVVHPASLILQRSCRIPQRAAPALYNGVHSYVTSSLDGVLSEHEAGAVPTTGTPLQLACSTSALLGLTPARTSRPGWS
jgi:hypothetical protein